jgi:outer membrane immunogenic protein
MKRRTSCAAALLLLLSSSAWSADLPGRLAEPLPPVVPAFTWTGYYLGGQIGYEFGRSSAVVTTAATGAALTGGTGSANGAVGGGHLGYLLSTQSILGGFGTGGVIGIEGDVDGTYARAALTYGVLNQTLYQPIQGSVRARAGVAFDRVLVYATGGVAFGEVQNNYVNALTGATDHYVNTRIGYTVGGGVEYALSNRFSVRGEYRYTDYGSYTDVLTTSLAGAPYAHRRDTDNRVQAGFSYKFDIGPAAPAPVVARY